MPKTLGFFSNRGLLGAFSAALGFIAAGAGAGFLPLGGCGGGENRGGSRGQRRIRMD